MTLRRVWTGPAVVLMLAGATASSQVQTPPRDPSQQVRMIPVGTGSISGVVVSADTGRPLRNARVSLSGTAGITEPPRNTATAAAGAGGAAIGLAGAGGATAAQPGRGGNPGGAQGPRTLSVSRTAVTNEQGQFTFASLAAGRYSVQATRDGYLNAAYGQRRQGTPVFPLIVLGEGEHKALSMALSRGAVVTGQVLDEDGEPVRGVQVQLQRIDTSTGVKRLQTQNSASTDDRGTYRFFGLQAGGYIIAATPRNNVTIPANMAADMTAIERAIAAGKVQTSASGGPSYVTIPAPATTTDVIRAAAPFAVSSDGTISLGTLGNATPSYLPIYYPGSLTPDAAVVIQVTDGSEHGPFTIPLQMVQSTIVAGTVANMPPDGVNVQVMLTNQAPLMSNNRMQSGVNQQDGTFAFRNVPPGRYTLLAQNNSGATRIVEGTRVVIDGAPAPTNARILVENSGSSEAARAEPRFWALGEVYVQGEPFIHVALALKPGRTISGTVVFDVARPPDLTRSPQTLMLAMPPGAVSIGSQPQALIEPDGRFTFTSVVPGPYVVRGGSGTMRSAMLSGEDLLDAPLDFKGDEDITGLVVTFTDKQTQITGTVTAPSSNAVAYTVVVAAAIDEKYWRPGSRRIALAVVGPDGRYTLRLPAGDYAVALVGDLDNGAQFDPEFLQGVVSSGARVTLREGASVTQDFRLR